MGYALGRKMTKNGKNALEHLTGASDAVIAIGMTTVVNEVFICRRMCFSIFNTFSAQCLDNPQMILVGAASSALGEIGRCGIIPLPDDDSNKFSKLSIVMKLSDIFKSSKYSTKVIRLLVVFVLNKDHVTVVYKY